MMWNQDDDFTPMEHARRALVRADTALEIAQGLVEPTRSGPVGGDTPRALMTRLLSPAWEACNYAMALLEAYDYYLERCDGAGLTPDAAYAGWERGSSEAFERDLYAATADYGFSENEQRMIAAQILLPLGIPSVTLCLKCGEADVPVTAAMGGIKNYARCPACLAASENGADA